jgi:hypothetical protein
MKHKTYHMMSTASPRSILNQKVGKNMVALDRIPSDPAISRHVVHLEFVDGAFWKLILPPDQWRYASSRSLSWRERDPRTITFIHVMQAAPRHPPATCTAAPKPISGPEGKISNGKGDCKAWSILCRNQPNHGAKRIYAN